MKILILSWRGPKHPNAGGAEASTHEHAKAWVTAGHSVTLFTSYFPKAKREEVIDGVKVIRQGVQIFGVHLAAFFWYFFGRHSKFDLVVDQFHGIPFFTSLYVRAKKLAFIHEVAKEVWWFNPLPRPFNLIPAIIGPAFEPWLFKLVYRKTLFMTVSESTKKDLVHWGIPKENITVIHNGVTLNLPKTLPKKERKKTAIFLGALAKDKGIEDVLRVFSEIDKKEKDWQFWVVGRGDKKITKFLISEAEKLGIKEKIRFWGYVGEKKKFELLARAHVLINPSVREGWGLVNIEANSVGTPVVGYNVAGVRDSVKNGRTGLLSKPRDTRKMAANALKLVSNQVLYKKVQENALAWSKKFKWELATKKSLKLIETL